MPGRRPKIHELLSKKFGHSWHWDSRRHTWDCSDLHHFVYRNKNSKLFEFVLVGPKNTELRRFDLVWLQEKGKVHDIQPVRHSNR